jgi:hypothetical protein
VNVLIQEFFFPLTSVTDHTNIYDVSFSRSSVGVHKTVSPSTLATQGTNTWSSSNKNTEYHSSTSLENSICGIASISTSSAKSAGVGVANNTGATHPSEAYDKND